MTDLERAKSGLENNTLCLVKGERVIQSSERGILPLVEAVDSGEDLSGFSAADLIVGKAAALIYAYAGIKEVYARTLSESAERVFKERGISYGYSELTEKIINRAGDGACPMERAVADIDEPRAAFEAVKLKLKELQNKKGS